MRAFEIVLSFLLGVLGGLAATFLFERLHPQKEVYVVDLVKLRKEGISKGDIEKVLSDNVLLIDRRCVLNPRGRDITPLIERAVKGRKFER